MSKYSSVYTLKNRLPLDRYNTTYVANVLRSFGFNGLAKPDYRLEVINDSSEVNKYIAKYQNRNYVIYLHYRVIVVRETLEIEYEKICIYQNTEME